MAAQYDPRVISRKAKPCRELLCEYAFRPVAHLVVLALLPFGTPPPLVVCASAATGIAGAVELARGHFLLAALLVQAKTVLDNADGQLARAANRVTPLGRYTRGRATREGLQLGFAAVTPPEIRRGVRELAAALEEVR